MSTEAELVELRESLADILAAVERQAAATVRVEIATKRVEAALIAATFLFALFYGLRKGGN